MQTDIVFTPFEKDHIEEAVRLSRAAGWPHRAEDWDMVLSLSEGRVGIVAGKVAATAIASPFGPVATVNMVIVDEALRGQGLGRKIMETAMEAVTPSEWRLVATRDGLPLYEKLGFEAYDEVAQYQGLPNAVVEADDIGDGTTQTGLCWGALTDINALTDLDGAATGMERLPLLLTLFRVGKVLVLKEGGKIVGWSALRAFGRGNVAGPVIARSDAEAKQLLTALIKQSAGTFLRVDTTVGTGLGDWLEAAGLAYAGGGISMRKTVAAEADGSAAAPSDFKTFALASQALG